MNFDCLKPDDKLVPYQAYFFSWTELNELCSSLLSESLQRSVVAYAAGEERYDTWQIKLTNAPLAEDELAALMDFLGADDFDREANDFGGFPIWELSCTLSQKLVAARLPIPITGSHAADNGVWFTSQPVGETPSDVYAVNVIRQRIEGMESELYFSNYLVSSQQNPNLNEKTCEALLRKIAADFLRTQEGKKAYEDTCQDFNWGDMETYIPDEFFRSYGVTRCKGTPYLCCGTISFIVNQDELLGSNCCEENDL